MQTTTLNRPVSTKALWAGRIMASIAILFLAFDTVMKVLELAPAMETTTQLGYPAEAVFTIGIIQLICLIVYVAPRTAVLGAVLLTGYLGGAVATHVRVENPLFSHVLFPVYIGLLLWAGLYLTDERVRMLIPLRKRTAR